MKKIIVILILVSLVLVGGMCKKGEEKIELKMDKTVFDKGEVITTTIKSEKKLFTGFPAFEVQQLVDDEWQYIDIYDMACALPCSVDEKDICTEQPIACAPLPEHCQDFDPLVNKFEWDQTVLKIKNVECPNLDETRTCSFKEKVESGKYKIVFQYSENCINKDLFDTGENNIQIIEKEFEILSLFADIPEKCLLFKENICDLFDCMMDLCWCDELSFPSPILTVGSREILNEQEAIAVVRKYLQISSSEYTDVRKAVRLNNVFFNVFVYTEENEEKVFTVAVDGTIFLTACGI